MNLLVVQTTVVVTEIIITFLLSHDVCPNTEVPKHTVLLANENVFPRYTINAHNVDIAEYLV